MLSISNGTDYSEPEIESFTIISSNGKEISPQNLPKQRGRKRKYIDEEAYRLHRRQNIFCRIPRRDLRREIAIMYNNAFNSGDPQFFGQFFQHLCTQNISLQATLFMYSPPLHNDCVNITTNGLQEHIISYTILTNEFPDLCSKLVDIRIIRRLYQSDVEIRCHVKTLGTNPFSRLSPSSSTNFPISSSTSNSLSSRKRLDFSGISNPINKQEYIRYLHSLHQFYIDDNLTLYLNEQGLIYDIRYGS